MDDLIPFLIFIVVVIINLVKYAAEKGGKSKAAPKEGQPERKPSALENFFADLAQKLEPQPTDIPKWPEDRERPDYMKEMEAYDEAEAFSREETAEIIPMPPVSSEPKEVPLTESPSMPEVQPTVQARSVRSALRLMPAQLSGIKSLRLDSSSMLRNATTARLDFPLKEKADLRKAIIANVVFGSPRAYDTSFENTVLK